MKKLRLEDAFPPMDEGFVRAANRAFGQIREEKNMKYRSKFSMVLVLMLVLALAGTALAAGISRMRQELEAINATGAIGAVQDVNAAFSAGGCTVTVKETLLEGADAWVTLQFDTPDDQPMLVAVWEEHEAVVGYDTAILEDMMQLVGGGYSDEFTLHFESRDGGKLPDTLLDIELALAKPLVDIDGISDHAEWDSICNGEKMPPVDRLTVRQTDGYGNGYVPVGPWREAAEESYDGDPMKWNTAILETMHSSGVVEQPVYLTARAELAADSEGDYVRSGIRQSEFEFDGYRVVVDRVLIGEVDASIGFRIIPERSMEEMTMDNNDPLWRAYELFDNETGAQYHASSTGGTNVGEDGKVYYEVEMFISAMGAHSDTLRVVPFEYVPDENGDFNTLDGKASIAYCEDEAFVIELIP